MTFGTRCLEDRFSSGRFCPVLASGRVSPLSRCVLRHDDDDRLRRHWHGDARRPSDGDEPQPSRQRPSSSLAVVTSTTSSVISLASSLLCFTLLGIRDPATIHVGTSRRKVQKKKDASVLGLHMHSASGLQSAVTRVPITSRRLSLRVLAVFCYHIQPGSTAAPIFLHLLQRRDVAVSSGDKDTFPVVEVDSQMVALRRLRPAFMFGTSAAVSAMQSEPGCREK